MRLLNTETLHMEEFFFPPPYAILSHCWGKHEVSYEEFMLTKDKSRPEFSKITQFARLARARNHNYVWLDTCCIDKRSSAELSEAINSMWEWYTNAKECIALLADVNMDVSSNVVLTTLLDEIQRSVWFSRGWTLQELLAPRIVVFVNANWDVLGEKTDLHILGRVSRRTGIPKPCLINRFSLHSTCIAQKLSWAASRNTTRLEDQAYCLLGLLEVNMPLLYGEGANAFLRLQQVLISQSDDESIFAWRHIIPPPSYMTGALATNVKLFAHSGDVRLDELPGIRHPYSITNKGLQFRSHVTRVSGMDVDVIPLNCIYGPKHNPSRCTMAVIVDNNTCYRFGTARLGEHLENNMFAGMPLGRHEDVVHYIQISRWQQNFQPAVFLLKRSLEKYRQRKLVENAAKIAAEPVAEEHPDEQQASDQALA